MACSRGRGPLRDDSTGTENSDVLYINLLAGSTWQYSTAQYIGLVGLVAFGLYLLVHACTSLFKSRQML